MAISYSGYFFDGKVATRWRVRVLVRDRAIEIVAAEDVLAEDSTYASKAERSLAQWPIEKVHFSNSSANDEPDIFKHGFKDAARLSLDPSERREDFCALFPNLRQKNPTAEWRLVLRWGVLAMVSIGLIYWVGIPYLAKGVAKFLPIAIEQEIGEQAVDELVEIFATFNDTTPKALRCSNKQGRQALESLMSRLTNGAGIPLRLQVLVFDDKTVNAFALPGGNIVLFRGLLEFAEGADEVAAVLAHEMGHVFHRHPLGISLEVAGGSLLVGLLIGDVFGGSMVGGIGQMLIATAYSRDAEREADTYAMARLSAVRIAPKAFAAFFERSQRLNKGKLPEWFNFLSTHPSDSERIAMSQKPLENSLPALSAARWKALQNICK